MNLSALILLATAASAPQLATRAEVAAYRATLEQRFEQEKAECEQRFSVSACLDDVRKRQQKAMAPLVRHDQELDARERRQRAAAQMQRVRDRELAAAQDEGQRRERLLSASPPSSPAAPASHAPRALTPEQAAQTQRQAAQKAEAEAAQRRERAKERELRQQQRLAAHEAKEKNRTKPLAAPLPLPGASAASK